MNSIYIDSAVISFIYFIVKFFEMRTIEKENKPLKYLVKDTLLVFFSVLIGFYVLEQIKPAIKSADISHPSVFVDHPNF